MLAESGHAHIVCVATQYGSNIMEHDRSVTVNVGRMDCEAMKKFLADNCMSEEDIVVDATHPYATEVSSNISDAVRSFGSKLVRIKRSRSSSSSYDGISVYASVKELAEHIDKESGNILLTTGSNALETYRNSVSASTLSRTFVRVLPAKESMNKCYDIGIDEGHIIAMLGPFSDGLNREIMKQYAIEHLVTKDSGNEGGFNDKIEAARGLGVKVHVIARPVENAEEAVDIYEAYETITGRSYEPKRKIILAGIGPGTECVTREVSRAIADADAVFGAGSVIANVNAARKYEMYLAKDIIGVLEKERDIHDPIVLFSGDTGFYSGAKEAAKVFDKWDGCESVTILPGISSVSYLAAKLAVSYGDAAIVSIHGQNSEEDMRKLARIVSENHLTFALLSSAKDVPVIAKLLKESNVDATLFLGCDLGTPMETIKQLTVDDALIYSGNEKITVLFNNALEDKSEIDYSSGIMIAASGSGSGKTVITSALLDLLKKRGLEPVAFKCGPDYIDPMFHRTVLGIDSINLDTYLAGPDKVRELFDEYAKGHAAVTEGVMGIYDGIAPGDRKGSCYEIASKCRIPIILVVNAKGSGATIVSLIKGVLADDDERLIKGIILNMISDGFYDKLLPYLKDEIASIRSDVRVLGHVPKCDQIHLESRHLGLKMPGEIEDLHEQIATVARLIENNCDLDTMIDLISGCADSKESSKEREGDREGQRVLERTMRAVGTWSSFFDDLCTATSRARAGAGPSKNCFRPSRIAVARDQAFCFYYPQNLKLLENIGFKIEFFSPLRDKTLPADTDAILIGGGYPELYLPELSANTSMLHSIRDAILGGIPSLAECGGFMYLHKGIEDGDGKEYEMVGVIDGKCTYSGHLVNFGYTQIIGPNEDAAYDFGEAVTGMRGHEFHYYESTCPGSDLILCKPSTGKEYKGMHLGDDHLWGWPHLYYPSGENVEKLGNIFCK